MEMEFEILVIGLLAAIGSASILYRLLKSASDWWDEYKDRKWRREHDRDIIRQKLDYLTSLCQEINRKR